MNRDISQAHCCETMRYWATYRCQQHAEVASCPDNIVFYSEAKGAYGIRIHDGGSSYIEIRFCPWCGASLAPNKARRETRRERRASEL